MQIAELATSFTVLEASNLKVSPSEVEVGQPVTLTADLQNVAETQVTYHCCLLCQGKEVKAKDITVAGSSIEKVTFTLSQATSGMYKVELLGLSVSFTVLKPAEFKVVSLDIAPSLVKVGDETTITTTIENIGEAKGTYNATLVVDGLVEQTRDVTLAGGATKPVSFLASKDSPGSYNIEIGEQGAILEVVQPVRLETGIIFRELSRGDKARLRIKNSIDLDVVVVLCSSEEPKVPLLALYVQSDDSYTAMKIRGGTYVLYYTFGEDWYDDSQKFLSRATYHQYRDEIHFKDSSRRYTIWTFDFDSADWADVYKIGEDEFPSLG